MACSDFILHTASRGLVRACDCHRGQPALPPSTEGPIQDDYAERPVRRGDNPRRLGRLQPRRSRTRLA